METSDRNRMDEWLDSALRQYGNVQPRAGLEGRIATSLVAQHRLVRRRWRLTFTFAAVTCAILVTIWLSESARRARTNVAELPAAPVSSGMDATRTAPVLPETNETVHRKTPRSVRRAADSEAAARSKQFPSPSPLTERELVLARYVTGFPKEAEGIAQEQQNFEQEMQQAALELRKQTQFSDQER